MSGDRMRMTYVVGTRPNFMKVAPLVEAAGRHGGFVTRLVHTGQHYDERMSAVFFEELGLPDPDACLGVGSGSHAVQTARVMEAFDAELDAWPCDIVVVVGDVNSTLACALVSAKRQIPVAHVEAGLRSGDRSMPEEINRILTDQISDYLFTTDRGAEDNLVREGVDRNTIHVVGNVMIDTLLRQRERAARRPIVASLALDARRYVVCTLHRPSNVDSLGAATNTVDALEIIARVMPVVIPLHPRTRSRLQAFSLLQRIESWRNARVTEPLGYLDFLCLMDQARFVFTDSGGVQEETTALGVPCLTFRDRTERLVTVTEGSNVLVGVEPSAVARELALLLARPERVLARPPLWDGGAADRITAVLAAHGLQRGASQGHVTSAPPESRSRGVTTPTNDLRQDVSVRREVGVVIPVRNRPTSIVNALASVLNQSVRPLRIVVVDDGSSDSTAREVQRVARHAENLSLVTIPHSGPATARNIGLQMLDAAWRSASRDGLETGDDHLVAFLDSDDVWPSDFLLRAEGRLASRPELSLVVSDRLECFHGSEPRLRSARCFDTDPWLALRRQSPQIMSCAVFRRRVLGDRPFPDGCFMGEDAALLIQLLADGAQTAWVPGEPVVAARIPPGDHDRVTTKARSRDHQLRDRVGSAEVYTAALNSSTTAMPRRLAGRLLAARWVAVLGRSVVAGDRHGMARSLTELWRCGAVATVLGFLDHIHVITGLKRWGSK